MAQWFLDNRKDAVDEWRMHPYAQYKIGYSYQMAREYEQAIREYQKVIERYPKSNWSDQAKQEIDEINRHLSGQDN